MASKNSSTSATTIKTMYNLLNSDTWTLDKCTKNCNYNNELIIQDEIILDKYYSYFKEYLIDINIDEKYYYNPQMFAEDYYGTADLDFLVLYFADMKSLFEFNKPKIKVLSYSHLNDINKVFTKYKKDIEDNKNNPPLVDVSALKEVSTSAQYIKHGKNVE